MQVLDVLCSPWAIQPDKLLELRAIYLAHARGDGVDIAAVEAKLGRKLDNTPKRYSVVDGVAVLPLDGVLAKRMNLFMQVSGGTSTQLAARDLRDALNDPEVHSVVLAVDSPGGTVDGTQALADMVRAAASGEKPIVTWASGTMASAAYWIGSAGLQAYIGDATTQVGSIGVVATHVDVSAAEAQKGVRTTEITAGKYKRVASAYAPLSEEGRKTLQDQVDYTYSVFVDAVAQNRRVSVDQVLERMADGRVFLGAQAIDAGLVDGIATLDEVVAGMKKRRMSASSTASITQEQSMSITREQVAAEAPDLVASLQAEGAAAERARIKAVEDQSLPGHEKLIAALKFDGKTTGPEAASQVLAAERKSRETAGAALLADAPQPVPHVSAPAYTPAADQSDDTSIPVEDRCKAKWDASAEIRREFGSLKTYTAFVKASERGVARILSRA